MAKLALMGGPKTVTVDRAKFAVPSVSEEAMAAVVDLMRKGETSNSPIVAEFEREFADYVGSKYGMALTSGTAALHTALFAAGAGPGDEVIAPSYTFIAGASIIAPTGAMAVFADVDRDTMNLDPEDIERKIKKAYCPRKPAAAGVHDDALNPIIRPPLNTEFNSVLK
ncbi:MAG: aminotransferase class I/II-fold pyridoxal phosphate-dependent enzyme, partial [Candidatus Latescibacteria bacterium]|nr:aminotransferase class I/II-fold pyridoxal phosphate-dependent enzyme [Candidatus Latescibacterota bacterium]